MKKIQYVKPRIKCVEIHEELMGATSGFTTSSKESIFSHEEGGGEVLAKPNSFLDNIGSGDPQPSSIEWGD